MATIQDPGELAKHVDQLEKDVAKWQNNAKSLDTVYQKKWAEFSLINSALWEGHAIVEKKTQSLTEARSTFEKMTVKGVGLRKDLTNTGKLARDTQVELRKHLPKFESTAKDVEKLLTVNKTSSLLKDAKASCAAQIKLIEKLINQLEADAQDCEKPPTMPTMPALPKA